MKNAAETITNLTAPVVDTEPTAYPLRGRKVLLCVNAREGTCDLCLVLQSLGAEVVLYPCDAEPQVTANCRQRGILVAELHELMSHVTSSRILIEDDARLSRWLHAHGLEHFGTIDLIIEQTAQGMHYWRERDAPCAIVRAGS